MKSETWKRTHIAGAWTAVAGIAMNGAIVAWLTLAPTAGTEYWGVPLKATTIVLDTSSLRAPIIVGAHSASAVRVPMDWADRARLVTAS